MSYMDPRPEGLNTEKAPESVVETLRTPDLKTVTPLTKEEWIKRAAETLERVSPGWTPDALADYADSLYNKYVTDCPDCDNLPEEAVAEDITYWD
jgi:hypothetical protein